MDENNASAPELNELPDSARIWRYFDLGKFVSFIVSESLYFASPKEFTDPFEGCLPISHVAVHSAIFQRVVDNMRALRSHLPVDSPALDAAFDVPIAQFIEKATKEFRTVILKFGFSCWHASDYESEAMWRFAHG